MNAVYLAIFGIAAFSLAYRFYARFLAARVFEVDPSRATPAHTKADGVDFVATDRHVLFGHHFTSVAGAAPIVGPAIAVIWGWVPAVLWVVLGCVFIGAVHDFGCLFVSARNGGSTIADLTGRIVGPRARFLFLLMVFFLTWIVIAVFAVIIGSLFVGYPATVLPVNFEILVAVVIGLLIHRTQVKLLVPSLVALAALYGMVWVGTEYTPDFQLPPLVGSSVAETPGELLGGPNPEAASGPLVVRVHGDLARRVQLPGEATELAATAAALESAVRALEPVRDGVPAEAYAGFSCAVVDGRLRLRDGMPGPGAEVAVDPSPRLDTEDAAPDAETGAVARALALGASGGARALPADATIRANRVQSWVILLVGYAFVASVLPVWVLLQPRDFINSHQLFLGLGAMYLGLFLVAPTVKAPALELSPPGAPGSWFPMLFITIACGAISGFHGLVASGTTSKQLGSEADAPAIGYGSMLGEGLLALMAVIACTAGFASSADWSAHYGQWGTANSLGSKLSAFVNGSASFLHGGLSLPLDLSKAAIAVIVISFAATTLDTATRIQRFIVQELASTYSIKPLMNRYVASALAAFLPLTLVFGGHWQELWPIFGASNQMLGGLCLLVLTFYLVRRGKRAWVVGVPTAFLALMTAYALVIKISDFVRRELYLLAGVGVVLCALSVWVLLEGLLTLRRLRASSADAGAGLE